MPRTDHSSSNEPGHLSDASACELDRLKGSDDDFGFGRPPGTAPSIGPGMRIGGIEIVQLLAVGGMGRVYAGRQESPARTVAVKVLRDGLVSPGVVRRFQHEAEILGRLRHPGIAHIYAAGLESSPSGEQPYSVMEFVVGAKTLVEYAAGHGLAPRDRVALFTQAVAAVAHAHREGIVHRDLKPGNILVDADGNAKVIDFGIARAVAMSDARLTTATELGQLLGTVRYMAPEQLGINGSDADARSDVYALGLVLHELLLGDLPYELGGRSVIEAGSILAARAGGDARPIARRLRAAGIARGEASSLAVMLSACLEPRPADRYQHAGELEADLRRWLAGEAIQARAPTLAEAIARLARRHRAAAAATLTVATTVAVMLGAVSWAWRTAEAERRNAAQARAAADAARLAAEEQRTEAETRATDARRELYFSTVLLAAEARDRDNLAEARRLLAEARNLAPGIAAHPIELDVLSASLDDSLTSTDLEAGMVTAVAASRQGDMIAAGTDAGRVALWASGQPARPVASVEGRVWAVAFSPDGTRVAVATTDGRVLVRDTATGQETASIEAHDDTVYGLDFSSDGRLLATASRDRSVRLWGTDSWEPRGQMIGHDGSVLSVAFAPDATRLLTTSSDGTARLWSIPDGEEIRAIGDGSGRLFRGTWSLDGRFVATAGEDGVARVHHASNGSLRATLAHPLRVNAVAFTSDGSALVTAAGDAVLRVWDVATETVVARRRGHAEGIWSLAVEPRTRAESDDTRSGHIAVVTGSADRTVRTWELGEEGEPVVALGGRGVAVAASPEGNLVAVGSDRGEILLVDPATLRERRRLTRLADRVNGLAFAPDGRTLAATDDSGTLHRWRLPDAEPLEPLVIHVRRAFDVGFHPKGHCLATAGEDRTARILDAERGEDCVPRLKHPSRVFGVAFAPSGDRLATACEDRLVRIWDTSTGSLVATWPGHARAVNWVRFSPDGRRVASASSDGTVRLWTVPAVTHREEPRSPPASVVLTGPSRQVWKVVFSQDGSRIAATSADGLVQLWDTATGRPVSVLRGHRDEAWGVAFLGDGALVTSSWDKTLRLWGVPMTSLAAARRTAQ